MKTDSSLQLCCETKIISEFFLFYFVGIRRIEFYVGKNLPEKNQSTVFRSQLENSSPEEVYWKKSSS